MKKIVYYASSILLLAVVTICLSSCDKTELSAQTETIKETIASTVIIAETSSAAETTVAETTVSEKELAAQAAAEEAQRKLDVISQFTLDYNEEEMEFYLGNTFIELYMYSGLHWAPQLLIKNWEKQFPVHELTLEYDDPVYGKIDLCFTGARIHDIFMSDIYFRHYPDCTLTEMDGTEHYYKKPVIENQEVYLVAFCEGKPFGLPVDDGTGPFWVIKNVDGKAEILAKNISMLKATLPQDKDLPSL